MSLENAIRQRLVTYALRMEEVLKAQAPVRQPEPPGGSLKNSIKINVVKTADGWRITRSYNAYGVYTNLGTKPYNDVKYGTKQSNPFFLPAWNPAPGKGIGGIQPRYWESLRSMVSETNTLKKDLIRDLGAEVSNRMKAKLKK